MRQKLKIILVLLFAFAAYQAFGQTTYYVKNGGNDALAGTSDATAWETIAKVNSFESSLNPGDSVLFNKGDTWSGTITKGSVGSAGKSGTAGNRITYGSYGEGEKPIITSLQTVNFSAYNDTVDYVVIATESNPNYILINGVWTAMGRYPNNNYLYFEWAIGTTKITDFQLPNTPNWTGAEVAIRKRDWVLDRNLITNHTDSIILYTTSGTGGSGYVPYIKYGYFIQNDYKTLDQFGEWYYDGDTLFVYSGAEDISSYTIQVPTITNLFYNWRASYITIDGLSFIGSCGSVIKVLSYADSVKIKNCDINFSGLHAIELAIARQCIVDSNTINHSIGSGIWSDSNINNKYTNNYILNTGMILGASERTDRTHGIYANSCDNLLIQYNRIDSSSYCGTSPRGHDMLVKNNYITNSLLLVCDGGGIYTSAAVHNNRQIIGNIVGKTRGNGDGTPNPTRTWARGIYTDTGAGDVTLSGNTTFEAEHGIFMGGGIGNKFYSNTSFDNVSSAMFIQDYYNIGDYPHSTDIEMKYNKFIAKKTDELSFRISIYDAFVAPTFAVSDSNYFARPLAEGTSMWQYGYGNFNIAYWRTLSEQDDSSKISPINVGTVDDFFFWYNPTQSDSIIALDTTYVDVTGKFYEIADTLGAYESRVLLRTEDRNPPDVPDVSSTGLTKHTRKTITISGNVTDDGGGIVSERGVCFSVVGSPSIADSVIVSGSGTGVFSTKITGLQPSTTYYFRTYAVNQEGPNYGEMYSVTTPAYNIITGGGYPVLKNMELIKY